MRLHTFDMAHKYGICFANFGRMFVIRAIVAEFDWLAGWLASDQEWFSMRNHNFLTN